jgi:hypothetical protein
VEDRPAYQAAGRALRTHDGNFTVRGGVAVIGARLAAALMPATLTGIIACDPSGGYPVQAAFAAPGPYATTTGTVAGASGHAIYALFYPSDYGALGVQEPGRDLGNTGSGHEIDAAAHYLVTQNSAVSSVFAGHLDTSEVAAAGHSQTAPPSTPRWASSSVRRHRSRPQCGAEHRGRREARRRAWLRHRVAGVPAAREHHRGAYPELVASANWPGSAVK